MSEIYKGDAYAAWAGAEKRLSNAMDTIHELRTELESLRAERDEARAIVIEADALSEKDKQPRSYEEASLAIVRMMSMGMEAMNRVQELEHELSAALERVDGEK